MTIRIVEANDIPVGYDAVIRRTTIEALMNARQHVIPDPFNSFNLGDRFIVLVADGIPWAINTLYVSPALNASFYPNTAQLDIPVVPPYYFLLGDRLS
jgi:hypothetical protein